MRTKCSSFMVCTITICPLCLMLLANIALAKMVPHLIFQRVLISNSFPCAEQPFNCSCQNKNGYSYDLKCPGPNSLNDFSIDLSFLDSNINVTCNGVIQAPDLQYLKRIKLMKIDRMEFYHCPMPNVPFRNVFQMEDIQEIQSIDFHNGELNQSRDILSYHLDGLFNLLELNLEDSPLGIVPPDALDFVPNLDKLYLRNTHLVALSKEAMDKIPKLTALDLSNNPISWLEPRVFSKLTSLEVLLLNNNRLGDALVNKSSDTQFEVRSENQLLSPDIFEGLHNLRILEMQNNRLRQLPDGFFKHLPNLRKLLLNNNQFEPLPAEIFRPLTKLTNLQLFENTGFDLLLPEGNFAHTSSLYGIDAEHSGICTLLENTFKGATSVKVIILARNRIKILSEHIFKDTTSLLELSLRGNQIDHLPTKIFFHLGKLRELDLSGNQIVNVPERMFWETWELKTLSIANNRLNYFSPNAFSKEKCKNLNIVDLSNNSLSSFYHRDYGSPLHYCNEFQYRYLDLSHNQLNYLSLHNPNPERKSEIFLTGNNISIVDWSGLEEIENMKEDAKNNKDLEEYDNTPITFYLDENPFHCDCQNYPLFRHIRKDYSNRVYDKINFSVNELYCGSPPVFRGRPVNNVSLDEVTCAVDCPELNAFQCHCHYRPYDKELLVNCQGMNLTAAPEIMPVYRNANHTMLNISNNAMNILPRITQSGYQHITKLHASHNIIGHIDISSIPINLEVLELDHNNLTFLEPTMIDYLKNMSDLNLITLHNNPWRCQCEDMPFIEFVRNKSAMVLFVDELKCSDGRIISTLTASVVCTYIDIWTIVSTTVLPVLIFALVLAVVYYRHQTEIKVWLFAHQMCLFWVTEEELDRDKEYDAFVCFSYKDEGFVENELIPNLTSGPKPFKLCIHTQNWLPGEYITNQIVQSVENSRRTVIVLSPNFVESEWGKLEFRVAHAQSMKEGRARIIVILLADVGPTENLDTDLQAYLKINTYIKWGDPKFWDKLRYALPHLPQKTKFHEISHKDLQSKLETSSDDFTPTISLSPSIKDILGDVDLQTIGSHVAEMFVEEESN